MSEEGKGAEGEKGHPDSVPWSQHVAAKETISNKLEASEKARTSLEEQLKTAPSKEAYEKMSKDLEDANTKLKALTDEKNASEEKTAAELRETLKDKLPEDELKGMSVAELQRAVKLVGGNSPSLPDLKGGGGSSPDLSKLSRGQLAVEAYKNTPSRRK